MKRIPGQMLRHVTIANAEVRIRQFTDNIVYGDSWPAAECPPQSPTRVAVIEIAHEMVRGGEQDPLSNGGELTAEPAKSYLQASYDQRDTPQRWCPF